MDKIDAYYKRLFSDKVFVKNVLEAIENNLKRKTLTVEKQYIANSLIRADPENFAGLDKKGIFNSIVDGLTTAILKNKCEEEAINMHEILKSTLGVATEDINMDGDSLVSQITNSFGSSVDVNSIMGVKDFISLKNAISTGALKKNSYIYLDTRYRLLTGDNNVITWNFVNNANAAQGTINAIGDVQNITLMKIHPFKIPYVKSAD